MSISPALLPQITQERGWLVLWPSLHRQKAPGGNASSAAVACGFVPCCYLPLAASCLTGSFPRVFHHRKFPVGKHLASKQRVPWYKRKVHTHAVKKKKKKTKQPPDETTVLKFCSQGYSSNVRISCCLTLLESARTTALSTISVAFSVAPSPARPMPGTDRLCDSLPRWHGDYSLGHTAIWRSLYHHLIMGLTLPAPGCTRPAAFFENPLPKACPGGSSAKKAGT